MRKKVKVLDLFCGLGGWSKGFAAIGFECIGVDIVNVGYPYTLILQDVFDLDMQWIKEQAFDVIVGSPPCRDFSRMSRVAASRNWKIPPDPGRGLKLVNRFLEIVREVKPQYWIMENVPRLQKYLDLKPICTVRMATPQFKRTLWGRFPLFLVPLCTKKAAHHTQGKYRSWKRAEIPLPVSCAAARVIKQMMCIA